MKYLVLLMSHPCTSSCVCAISLLFGSPLFNIKVGPSPSTVEKKKWACPYFWLQHFIKMILLLLNTKAVFGRICLDD